MNHLCVSPKEFSQAKRQALEGLHTFQPDIVFSKGGYVALPVIFAAKQLGIPSFTHESDFSLGLANRLSLPKCDRIFTSFPETATHLKRGQYSGAPLRRSLFSATKAEARKHFDLPFQSKVILIFGGGSGSDVINTHVRSQLKNLTKQGIVLHVCGKGNIQRCNIKNYHQFEFIADMGMAYACADLIISRAGAGTIFEILALKKPSILIPLEGQTRGDQKENAAYFTKKGLCYTLPQSKLELLSQTVECVLSDAELQRRLNASAYTSGNAIILRELKKALQ